jgi:glycosyltransferase involved in cell wall biosynthesis
VANGSDGGWTASVVIPTYRRGPLLTTVVHSVLADPATGEVIVIDDGGLDGAFDAMKDLSREDTRVIALTQENAGQASARRRGAQVASHDVLIFVDDDVEVVPGSITGLCAAHRDTANVVILGYMPVVLPSPRASRDIGAYIYSKDYEAIVSLWKREPVSIAERFWAGFYSIRRGDWSRVNSSWTGRLPYHEDVLFGIECRDAGLDIAFRQDLRARHHHERGLDGLMAEGRESGIGRAMLVALRPNLRSRYDPTIGDGLGFRALIWTAQSQWVSRMLRGAMSMIAAVGGATRWWWCQERAARVVRHIELIKSFQMALK